LALSFSLWCALMHIPYITRVTDDGLLEIAGTSIKLMSEGTIMQ
jgi:hypothetical protein